MVNCKGHSTHKGRSWRGTSK